MTGTFTQTFEWVAPMAGGTFTIYAAGISADGDGTELANGEDPAVITVGDGLAMTTIQIVVDAPPNQIPVAAITAPAIGTEGMPVTFDASASTDVDGTIISYDWDFGDTMVGTGMNTTHTYALAGTYMVTLTVTDDTGATNMATTNITINVTPANEAPVAMIIAPPAAATGMAVTFDASGSTDIDGTIISYDWDFGDTLTGTGVSATHSYAMAGTFTVTLTVTDDTGATNSVMTDIIVTDAAPPVNIPPVAMITAPATAAIGMAVTFDASASTDLDGTITSYDWDFGDTLTGTGVSATHSYAMAGTFTVTLTVTDDTGATNSAMTDIIVTDAAPPGNAPPVAMMITPPVAAIGMAVTFDASGSTDPDGTIASYDWDFGDAITGTGVSTTHTYMTAGTFTITLTVTDDAGATNSVMADITVMAAAPPGNIPPMAVITAPPAAAIGMEVIFDASTSTDPDGTIVSYDWDFGDTMVSTGVSTTHTYATEGTFTITLTVTDDAGATNSTMTDIIITAAAPPVNIPPAAMISGPTTGTEGVAVTFDASGSLDLDGMIVSYDWDLGDTMTATGISVTHTYSVGVYTVKLTVTDDAGATTSAMMDIVITAANAPQPPMADAGGPYMGTIGMAIQFDGSASTDPDGTLVSYDWDFGDTSMGTGATPTHAYSMAGTYTVMLTVTDNDGMAGSVTTTAIISDPALPPMPGPGPDGAALYNDHCGSCHGPGGVGGTAEDVIGESAEDIMEAIMEEPTMMFLLDVLRKADVMAIAHYLEGLEEAEEVEEEMDEETIDSTSVTLYDTFCASCHGTAGNGGSAKAVIGATVADIKDAITREQTMAIQVSVLSEAYIAQISDYLVQLDASNNTTGQTINTSVNANDSGGGGALYWLGLLFTGVLFMRRRRFAGRWRRFES